MGTASIIKSTPHQRRFVFNLSTFWECSSTSTVLSLNGKTWTSIGYCTVIAFVQCISWCHSLEACLQEQIITNPFKCMHSSLVAYLWYRFVLKSLTAFEPFTRKGNLGISWRTRLPMMNKCILCSKATNYNTYVPHAPSTFGNYTPSNILPLWSGSWSKPQTSWITSS